MGWGEHELDFRRDRDRWICWSCTGASVWVLVGNYLSHRNCRRNPGRQPVLASLSASASTSESLGVTVMTVHGLSYIHVYMLHSTTIYLSNSFILGNSPTFQEMSLMHLNTVTNALLGPGGLVPYAISGAAYLERSHTDSH